MATTATLITPPGVAFPYIGVGVPAAQLITPIPSAEVNYNITLGAITVAAGGQDQSLLINVVLPRTFCWVLVELTCRISGVDSGDWLDTATTTLQDSQSEPTYTIPLVFEIGANGDTGGASGQQTYELKHPPAKLIVPSASAAVVDDALLSMFFQNNIVDGAVGVVDLFARFLRFDRNQAQFWQVNTPTLIR